MKALKPLLIPLLAPRPEVVRTIPAPLSDLSVNSEIDHDLGVQEELF